MRKRTRRHRVTPCVVKKLPGAPSTQSILSMEFIVDTRVARAPSLAVAFESDDQTIRVHR